MSERREKILEVTGNMFSEQFEKSSTETVLHCEKESSRIIEGLLKALGEVISQAFCKEEKNNAKVQYLLFSCLHSSIFLQKYLIRIDLMGEGLYNDNPLGTSYWDGEDIYCLFEKDISEFRRRMEGKVPRIRAYEMNYVRYAYAPYYHRMTKAFISEMLEEMLDGALACEAETRTVQENTKEEGQIKIMFGEYMGEADILFDIRRERFYEVFQYLCRQPEYTAPACRLVFAGEAQHF